MIVIVDYGMGNLHSVQKAFEACECRAEVSQKPLDLLKADAIVVPGVGSFGDCLENLNRRGLSDAISGFIKSGRPYLGLCLGMQILFSSSEESKGTSGLNIFEGSVKRFSGRLKIPHMGWNTINLVHGNACPLFRGISDGSYFYFVHSYYAVPSEEGIVAAVTDYGVRFASAVWRGGVMATQFHPEKSQSAGLQIISNFIRFAGKEGQDARHTGG